MFPTLRRAALIFWAAMFAAVPVMFCGEPLPSIRRVQVLRGGSQVEIEIESSAPIVPQTNELGGPNRLLVDFVNATPGAQLRGQLVNRPEVKALRVSLFSADPPVTRIVLDLNGPQPYQVFPSGRTTIVKIGAPGVETAGIKPSSGNVVDSASDAAEAANTPPAPPKPSLEVSFHDGLLSINSDRASLSQILFEVHQRTGAEIAIPAGAEQEKVAAHLGPGPAPEVLSQLLNGSKFNFLILSAANDPRSVDQVILSPRAEGAMPVQPSQPQPARSAAEPDDERGPIAPPPPAGPPGGNPPPSSDGTQAPAPPANPDAPN